MSLGTTLFVHELEAEQVPYELLSHERTQTAVEEARALGLAPAEVAKTVVLETETEYVRAVLPASSRLDLAKVREALGAEAVRLATERTLAGAFPEFELGAVPPLAGPPDRVLVDRRVAEADTVVFEAGSHDMSVRVKTAELLAAARAQLADVCVD
jgi:Ala-tRNA(Pro) deacylase